MHQPKRPLVKHFDVLSEDELRDLVRASIANSQVWSAGKCRAEYLPAFIEANRHRIVPDDLRAQSIKWNTTRPTCATKPKSTLDRTAGSRPLAAAGRRGR
jgi:hypothetical protein